MLHITNGDNANEVLRQAAFDGAFLAWADVLHEGPVPAGLSLQEMSLIRARFISYCGWASEFEAQTHFQTRDALFTAAAGRGEVVIWNSRELYDQLHLLQMLAWYGQEGTGQAAPTLVFVPGLIGIDDMTAEVLRDCYCQAVPASADQLALAAEGWQAFTAPNPRSLAAFAAQPNDALPWLSAGLRRLLQEYPDLQGISRTERQVLQAVAAGEQSPAGIFRHSWAQEEVPFMGDSSFWLIIKGMLESPQPLLLLDGDQPFRLPGMFGPDESFLAQRLRLTAFAEQLLAGQGDWLAQHQIDRWVGGVHLNPDNRWRWDGKSFLRQ
ncbi:DUF1835 domain-containing protein [Marinobacterium arenosum]|uniref:DUF1835 domain-containing protein n=1 Tax=Marinobacterium arenosum TaxID=2862496 RepID=UPI001C94B5CC|nr:DUF1835 domain-containing protein [Marinobacterium arenosum]MBY4676287.1 DUF1835 domain-containing protein [Marinobacterium arenosum]